MSPNCTKCKHFYVTFDKFAPKGCRAFSIKSTQFPSIIVKQANGGQDCMGFEEKQKKTSEEDTKKNLNDDKYWKA